jgi:hypothetical protein
MLSCFLALGVSFFYFSKLRMALSHRKTLIIKRDALNLSSAHEDDGLSRLSAIPFDQSMAAAAVSIAVATPTVKRKRDEMLMAGTPSFLRTASMDDMEEELEYHERVLARYRKGTLQHYNLLATPGRGQSGSDSTLLLTNTPGSSHKGSRFLGRSSTGSVAKTDGDHHSILLSTGDVLVTSSDNLIFHKNCVHAVRAANGSTADVDIVTTMTLSPLPVKLEEITFFDILTNKLQGIQNDEVILMVCATSGSLYLWNTKSNDVSHHTLKFQEDDEIIRCIQVSGKSVAFALVLVSSSIFVFCLAGNRVILSTSTGDIYILERFVDEQSSYQLQRTRGVVAGILNAGAKLFGISSFGGSDRSQGLNYSKLIPMPRDSQLFCIGGTLTLWSNYLQPGEEQCWYDFSLGSCLRDDLRRALNTRQPLRCLVLDATVMEIDRTPGNNSSLVTILVLSAVASEQDLAAVGRDGLVHASLWMHTLEVPMERNGKVVTASGNIHVAGQQLQDDDFHLMYRMHLADNVLIDCNHLNDNNGSQGGSLNPKMFGMPPSWRVFISWTDATSKSIYCSQIDALNQSIPTGGNKDRYVIDYDSVMDTKINCSEVSTVSAITGLDGIFALRTGKILIIILFIFLFFYERMTLFFNRNGGIGIYLSSSSR